MVTLTVFCGVSGPGKFPLAFDKIVRNILRSPEGRKFRLLAPVIRNRKGGHRDVLDAFRAQGFDGDLCQSTPPG